MFPLFALCDRNDIGGISCPQHPQVGEGAIFVYDGHPGGIGLAARGYEIILALLEKTRDLVASCPCSEGCPACIHSPKCGSGNKPLDKQAALAVLKYLVGEWDLGRDIDGSTQPSHESPRSPAASPDVASASSPRIGFFDLETQRLADEVGGWHNKHLMRVSVAVLYDTLSESFRVYKEEDVPLLIDHLKQMDLLVGFNIASFDYQVLKAYTPFDFSRLRTFDILDEVHQRLGFRLSLDHLADKTLGKPKTSDGIQAVRWFRDRQWEPLINHCEVDVALTRDLFYHAMEKGYLVYADRKGRLLRLPTRWRLDELLANRESH